MIHFYKNAFRFCLPLLMLLFLAWPAAAQTYQIFDLGVEAGAWDMMADDNNNVHIIWMAYGYMYYGRITPKAGGGYEITGQETISSNTGYYGDDVSNRNGRPRIAVRRDGQTVHTVWGENVLRHAWRNTAGVWSKEVVRAKTTDNHFYVAPVCAVTPNETVHILYEYMQYPGPENVPMYYLYKTSGGAWSADINITPSPTNEYRDPSVFVDASGGLHVSYRRMQSSLPNAFYSYVAPGGTLSSSTPKVGLPWASDVVHNAFGDLFVDSTGRVHRPIATWRGIAGSQVTIDYTSKPAGGGFGTVTRPSIGAQESEEDMWPAVVTDQLGWVYVAFTDHYPDLLYLSVSPDRVNWTKYLVDATVNMNQHRKPALTVTNSNLYLLWRTNQAPIWDHLLLATMPNTAVTVTAPDGGENWIRYASQGITWTNSGVTANIDIELWKDGSKVGDIATNRPITPTSYSWSVGTLVSGSAAPGTGYKVRIVTVDDLQADESDDPFTIISEVESISTPDTPSGPIYGYEDVSYTYASGDAVSNHGHALEYRFDWGDGNFSSWSSSTSASHAWGSDGSYSVKAQARCATHTSVVSGWSSGLTVSIAVPGQYYNSPANRLLIPEVNWAAASGGGTWISELHLGDLSGGTAVSAYYNSGTTRRGPFTIWTNSGIPGRSIQFANILQTLSGLDTGFTYYGTSGTLELVTQDSSHFIQATTRTLNGNYSRTFPGLADVAANSADTSRQLMIPNISNNATYRPSVVLTNPSEDSVTVNLSIIGSDGVQIGSTIIRALVGYEMQVITSEVRANTYSNASIFIQPTSGSGRVMASGQSANNTSNDPAAHLAVQAGSGFANSPGQTRYISEVNWAAASGGGDWVSEVGILDRSGGAVVQVYYNSGTNRRGPFTLWTNSGGANRAITFANILQTIDGLDSGAFTYYGTSGTLELVTQDGSHLIQAAVRTYNGNFSRTLPAFADVDDHTASLTRIMIVPNLSNNSSYRPSVVFFNPTADSVTLELRIFGNDGVQIGSTITRTVAGREMNVVTSELRANTYSNANVTVQVISGSGRVLVSGQTANNVSNDPAGHVAVQSQ